jgi:hypothetical protein
MFTALDDWYFPNSAGIQRIVWVYLLWTEGKTEKNPENNSHVKK